MPIQWRDSRCLLPGVSDPVCEPCFEILWYPNKLLSPFCNVRRCSQRHHQHDLCLVYALASRIRRRVYSNRVGEAEYRAVGNLVVLQRELYHGPCLGGKESVG